MDPLLIVVNMLIIKREIEVHRRSSDNMTQSCTITCKCYSDIKEKTITLTDPTDSSTTSGEVIDWDNSILRGSATVNYTIPEDLRTTVAEQSRPISTPNEYTINFHHIRRNLEDDGDIKVVEQKLLEDYAEFND